MRRPAVRGCVRATAVVLLAVATGWGAWPALAGELPERPEAELFLGFPSTSPLDGGQGWTTEVAFPALTFNDPVFLIPEPGKNRLWVNEREGRILSFEAVESVAEARVVLDLRDQTQGDSDAGMLSMAFHPRYAEPEAAEYGWIYVAYAYREHTEVEPLPPLQFRLSRFVVDMATGTADPAGELVLIEQLDQHLWHQGGAILFHPRDGYLYITLGDEGGGRCVYGNCQRIDRDLFAGVLRIDVDCGPASHPIPRQPDTGTTAHYCIPDDNPFVGMPGVLEEFYALGLRSPHRMTHDPVDDLIWIGEVGQATREELDVLRRGANYQWNILEGNAVFSEDGQPPVPLIGEWTPPVLDYGRTTGGTVIGGYVYRGTAMPELRGRYIYGDFLSGRIWALSYRVDDGEVTADENRELAQTEFRGRTNGITSLGLDAAGEVYILTLGEAAQLHRLIAADIDPGELPRTLSATGLFTDLTNLTPIPALIPYDVRTPLWSDGTRKRRWMSIPTPWRIGWSADGHWQLPAGSVLVKHFELPVVATDPSVVRRLETRVLVVRPDKVVYGLTYKWRADGSDADLLTKGLLEQVPVVEADSSVRLQPYQYPGPTDCLVCHNEAAGGALGPRARQLVGLPLDASLSGADDQLGWLAQADYFDPAPDAGELASVVAMVGLDDESATLEDRVRSYLDANCSHCHGWSDLDRSLWDARRTTPLAEQGIVYGLLLGEYGGAHDFVVRPADPASSVMLLRTMSIDPDLRMPPLARNVEDRAFTDVLARWIESLDYLTTTTTTVSSTTSTTMPVGGCGDPAEPFDLVTAGDALRVLHAAVGNVACAPCVCDVSGNGSVTAADALAVLRYAVDLPTALNCPACG
jgi:glucose/arabinose dehydrogenase